MLNYMFLRPEHLINERKSSEMLSLQQQKEEITEQLAQRRYTKAKL